MAAKAYLDIDAAWREIAWAQFCVQKPLRPARI